MDTSNYREVQKQLKAVSPELAKALKRDLRTYAGEVATVAKANASWSQQIPSAIAPTATAAYAGVRVRGTLGPLYERGIRGRPWRHPLFKNRKFWYSQKPRPFLAPAIATTSKGALAKMERSIQAAARSAGF